jgi:hypothetical protein
MRRYVILFIIALYALGSTELHELLKLPVLTAHFIEHQQHDPKISFWEFIHEHYGVPQPMDADYKKDVELPFKSNITFVFHIVVAPTEPVYFNTTYSYPILQHSIIYQNRFVAKKQCKDIWQPPRC